MATAKKIKVTFTKSPTGKFGLAYSAGKTVSLDAKLANEIIEAGFGISAAAKKESEK